MNQKRVAIIGAGAAGLVCAKECIQEGLNVQIFEKYPYSGGMWVVDEVPLDLQEINVHEDGYKDKATKVHSSIYDEMQTNLSRFVMSFSDFPFDTEFPGSKDPRTFPGTDEVLRYLDAFKKEFELDKFISYDTEVVDIDRAEDSEFEWQVKINCKGEIKTLFFDSVAVCSGHYTVPQLPELKNIMGFGRPCLHSHLYRNPNRYKDKVVLILGSGSSGRDIVIEIAEVGKKVYFCARKWKSTLDLSKTFEDIKNVCCCKSISHCPAEGTVQLEDGTILTDVDEMLLCTGYSYDYPFLKNSGLISTAESFVYPVYKHIFHTKYPTLGFIGVIRFCLPFITFDCQSKYFSRVISGRCQLPDYETMMKDLDHHRQRVLEKNINLKYFHGLLLLEDPFLYKNELLALCGDCSKLPSWRKEDFYYYFSIMLKDIQQYRTAELPQEIQKKTKEDFESVWKARAK